MTIISMPLVSQDPFVKQTELVPTAPSPVSPLSSESDTSSDDDRSSSPALSTPASESSAQQSTIPRLLSQPGTCVYLPAPTVPEPAFLHNLFNERVDGQHQTLAVCLSCAPSVADAEEEAFLFCASSLKSIGMECGRWTKQGKVKEHTGTHYVSMLSKDDTDSPMASNVFTTAPVTHQSPFSLAALRPVYHLLSNDGKHIMYILERPPVTFPLLSATPSFNPLPCKDLCSTKPNIPTLAEWQSVWAGWDLVTLGMIPQEMLHQKPIDLRHKCLFYIGHIPTFLDMLLSKSIGGGPTEPKHFWNIFERGIDPHVDDPDHCHNHSDVPEKDEDWPALPEILGFRNGVRARLAELYADLESGKRQLTRNIARTLVMTIEHEGWHIETLLYMLLQRAGTGTLPPPGFTVPPFELLARQWDAVPPPSSSSVTLGPAEVVLGHDDSEGDDIAMSTRVEDVVDHMYGWDNESPMRTTQVSAFRAEWRPVSNKEFETFWRASDKIEMPKSWVNEDGEIKVRSLLSLIKGLCLIPGCIGSHHLWTCLDVCRPALASAHVL
ncbi:hypothetical protein HGRIS_002180 [Hohenbuehelia grisea]|uniref:DinB-like domain-containing protein n=1 Tax=Hohenbuehelia grisea TaxID=104357 RepID=A0ABR3JLL3_9AGAR